MSAIKIRREHDLGVEEAKRRVDMVADDIGGKFNLTSRWEGDYLRVQGTGVNGQVVVMERAVEVHVETGFAMMMFRETIRSAIESSIDDYID